MESLRLLAAFAALAVLMTTSALAQTLPATAPATPTAEQFQKAADYSASLSGRALLVMRNGNILHERYDNGWTKDRPHPLASGTKSFSGLLAAAAIEDGYIPSWDANVAETLEAWKTDPLKSQITLRQLLSLSSGLPGGIETLGTRGGGRLLGPGAARRNERLEAGKPEPDDLYAAALSLPLAGKPGAQFQYGPSHFYAFGAYLEARLERGNAPQRTADAYLKARITDPLGLSIAFIGKDKAGHPKLPGGMLLTAREWAKLGQLVLDDGACTTPAGERKQLIRKDLLAELFIPSRNNPHYGLTWWLPSDAVSTAADDADDDATLAERLRRRNLNEQVGPIQSPDGKPVRAYLAAGLGKQRLLVLPDLDLVIVRFAEATAEGLRYSDAKLVALVMGWKK